MQLVEKKKSLNYYWKNNKLDTIHQRKHSESSLVTVEMRVLISTYLDFPDMKSDAIFSHLSERLINHAIADALKSILSNRNMQIIIYRKRVVYIYSSTKLLRFFY